MTTVTTLPATLRARRAVWQPWLSTASRLFLAGVLLVAGWPKFLDPEGTVRSVRAFQILPEAFVRPFAYGLPMLELVLGLLLLVGLGTRFAGAATAALMVMFLGGIVSAWARGLSIDCGCFGNAGEKVADPVAGYIRDIFRDLLFLGAAVLLMLAPRSRFAVDGLLGLHPEPRTDAAEQPTKSRPTAATKTTRSTR